MDDEKKLQLKKKTELLAIVLGDLLILFGVSVLALWLRFEFHYKDITPMFLERMYKYMPIHLVCSILLFYFCGMYKSIWRYASISEVGNIITGCFLTTMLQWVVMWKISYRMPVSFHCMTFVFLVGFITLDRFAYRIIVEMKSRYFVTGPGNTENVMIVGAGDAGRVMLKEFHESQYIEGKVVCFIDDSPEKIGKALNGVPIVGDRNYILQAVDEYSVDEIIVAIPTISAKERSKILHICQETQCSVRMLPGVYQLINGEVNINSLRKVEVEDLLGRDQIKVDLNQIMGYVSGKRIMVTGGGGSIGSELCRQIASKKPEMLIIVDIYENNAYEIQQELLYKYPELNLVVLIASVRNTNRINEIFKTYKPQIVYHAAAHKHVPLMETSPNEAIKNNVFGTLKTARAAGENGVEKFVMISTDKAVNPTNIMGASKRICEMVIQTMNKEYKTDFVAVRFGNVLGSNGSVIPLFKKQIEHGGPVTVTHPDIIRYFMTISEAVSLVLQAGAYAKGGEIFVLDMGEPVKIYDLAVNLIRLSGFKPNEEIRIAFTGLRPGEKLFEELLMDEEGLKKTDNELIFIGKPIEFDEEKFIEQLTNLGEAAVDETKNIKKMVQEIVPTYIMNNNE
ncbi:MAG: polysaccharide biosynthesis protein [Lachnospiraceae bacterium]|nr:polysaccharide biosynthesis protein [Lachnospiraceae bacterium]